MENVPAFFATTGALLGTAGIYNSYHGRTRVGAFQQTLGGLCLTVAAIAQPVFAQATPTQSDENGEYWMGHYFPYAQYPHGHFDCGHGSSVYEQLRSADNERRRNDFFYEDNICIRGIGNLMKPLKEYLAICYANGQKTQYERGDDL